MQSRAALLLNVLLKEIAPATLKVGEGGQAASARLSGAMLDHFEKAVEDLPEVPPEAMDSLKVLRVTCAVWDTTCQVDFETIE
eukprot:1168791-Pyramimonas_sp.AAC.1